jgi:hypothetical protein
MELSIKLNMKHEYEEIDETNGIGKIILSTPSTKAIVTYRVEGGFGKGCEIQENNTGLDDKKIIDAIEDLNGDIDIEREIIIKEQI